ncbi:AraC family transcriptional regulator [Phytoactinopolyspora alkaliphila]|uniref:AraC family transcriptional regulator n=1 Tax=Phytoactinopolyspora alkaliphila TaxID=1783498 RepID=A0A6N9YNS1_9ACTN|nr:AraC family transcriptional regulator [Phytoactinopolyspora alkaliphila]NED96711.1 AraC family transcriptional regulator [Phytoactinopolyspora alkaliphila]
MTGLPLERFELFHSTDLDEARDIVGRVFVPHRLDLVGKSKTLDARMHTRRIGRVAANYVEYGGDVLIEPGELGSFFVVQIPLSGHCTVSCGNEVIYSKPGFASVVSPTEPLSMRWSRDCTMLILRIERPALEAHLRDLLGAPLPRPVRFSLGMDVGSGFGLSWANGVRYMVHELDRSDDSLVNNQLAATELENGLLTGLLLSQRHNYSDLLDDSTLCPVPSRAVSIARELIENHPEWRHTVNMLAKEANVSVRALQHGFAKHLGMSPRRYLTAVRMQRAREELRAAQRDAITVGQVVAKWGLGHPGRFAAEYQRRFGELPSETLEN